jgi:hypothetical protein
MAEKLRRESTEPAKETEVELRNPMTEAAFLAPDFVRPNLDDLVARRNEDGGVLLLTRAEVRIVARRRGR